MNTIQKHKTALNKASVYYHKFLSKYKNDGINRVYLFCEGNEDVGYYAHAVQTYYAQIEIVKFNVEGKTNVLNIHDKINWDVYCKDQILFFIDRDMSYWLNELQEFDDNIYITDGYSFENDIVDVSFFIRVLEDVYGFVNATDEEMNDIRELYSKRWDSFVYNSQYIMGALAVSLKYKNQHLAKNIDAKNIIKITKDRIWADSYKGVALNDYILQVLEISIEQKAEIEMFIERFQSEPDKYSVRGKWAIIFFVKMLDYIVAHKNEYIPSLLNGDVIGPKCLCEIKINNATTILGTRVTAVKSLEDFCKKHISKYLKIA